MSENLRFAIAIISGFASFIFLFIFMYLKGNNKNYRLKIKAEKNKCVVTAKAIKHKYRRFTGPEGKYRGEVVSYEYLVNDKQYIRKIRFRDNGIIIDYPEEITIYYNSNNPAKSIADIEISKEKRKQTGCYFCVVVPIVIVVLIFNLLKLI